MALARPEWQILYEVALLELDRCKLPVRIAEARHAMLDRAGETLRISSDDAQHNALNNALHALRVLEEAARQRTIIRSLKANSS